MINSLAKSRTELNLVHILVLSLEGHWLWSPVSKQRRGVDVKRFWFKNKGQDYARVLVHKYAVSFAVNLLHQIMFKRMYEGGIPLWSSGWDLALSLPRAQVQSLVAELRSADPQATWHGQKKEKKSVRRN